MKRRGWLIALCVMALMVGAFYGAATLNARHATQEQRALLEDAITRALVTCYAVEGRYPSSLSYLEENYGVEEPRTCPPSWAGWMISAPGAWI